MGRWSHDGVGLESGDAWSGRCFGVEGAERATGKPTGWKSVWTCLLEIGETVFLDFFVNLIYFFQVVSVLFGQHSRSGILNESGLQRGTPPPSTQG